MLPGILNQLGAESLTHLKRLASNVTGGGMGGAGLEVTYLGVLLQLLDIYINLLMRFDMDTNLHCLELVLSTC